jgi:hypothetical protein
MKVTRKAALTGGGIAAALAAIAVGIGLVTRENGAPPAVSAAGEQAVCLKTDIPLIEGADKKCYAPSEVAALADRAVLDDQGAPATVELSHPTDVARAPQTAASCRQYEALAGEGWYALSSRDIRREAYFRRACAVLDLLEKARLPDVTYFEGGALSEADVESLAETAPFRIGPVEEAGAGETTISKEPDSAWRIASDGQIALLQEIAHADFDGDGRGDMLVFVAMRLEDGTATASMAGLLEKASASGPVAFVAKEEGPPRAF